MTYFFKLMIFGLILCVFSLKSVAQINQYHDNGTRHGKWEKKFEGTDQIRYTGTFNHGVEIDTFKFYKRGFKKNPTAIKIFSENGKKAQMKFYTQNGRLISEGVEIDRRKEGKWKYYHNNSDRIMMIENYIDGKLEGERTNYYDNGTVSEKVTFLNGVKNGKQLVYSVKGILIKEFTYKNGLLEGPNKFYSGRGNITIDGNYKNNKKTGVWKYYDVDGNVIREKPYK